MSGKLNQNQIHENSNELKTDQYMKKEANKSPDKRKIKLFGCWNVPTIFESSKQ